MVTFLELPIYTDDRNPPGAGACYILIWMTRYHECQRFNVKNSSGIFFSRANTHRVFVSGIWYILQPAVHIDKIPHFYPLLCYGALIFPHVWVLLSESLNFGTLLWTEWEFQKMHYTPFYFHIHCISSNSFFRLKTHSHYYFFTTVFNHTRTKKKSSLTKSTHSCPWQWEVQLLGHVSAVQTREWHPWGTALISIYAGYGNFFTL